MATSSTPSSPSSDFHRPARVSKASRCSSTKPPDSATLSSQSQDFHRLPRVLRQRRCSSINPPSEYNGMESFDSQGKSDKSGRRLTVSKLPKMENTYRMAPEPKEAFLPHVARSVMETVLRNSLEGQEYDRFTCRTLSMKIANTIKEIIKQRHEISKRYRYVSQVCIGEKRDQGVQISSRCLWNSATDNFASAEYSNKDLFALAMLHAVYFE